MAMAPFSAPRTPTTSGSFSNHDDIAPKHQSDTGNSHSYEEGERQAASPLLCADSPVLCMDLPSYVLDFFGFGTFADNDDTDKLQTPTNAAVRESRTTAPTTPSGRSASNGISPNESTAQLRESFLASSWPDILPQGTFESITTSIDRWSKAAEQTAVGACGEALAEAVAPGLDYIALHGTLVDCLFDEAKARADDRKAAESKKELAQKNSSSIRNTDRTMTGNTSDSGGALIRKRSMTARDRKSFSSRRASRRSFRVPRMSTVRLPDSTSLGSVQSGQSIADAAAIVSGLSGEEKECPSTRQALPGNRKSESRRVSFLSLKNILTNNNSADEHPIAHVGSIVSEGGAAFASNKRGSVVTGPGKCLESDSSFPIRRPSSRRRRRVSLLLKTRDQNQTSCMKKTSESKFTKPLAAHSTRGRATETSVSDTGNTPSGSNNTGKENNIENKRVTIAPSPRRTSSAEELHAHTPVRGSCVILPSLSLPATITSAPSFSIPIAPTPVTALAAKSLSAFLHPDCRLQKDKGKGETPGSLISVAGRQNTIDKLQEKMDIMMDIKQGAGGSSATLKRSPAILLPDATGVAKGHVKETRSTIGVKLGFLSVKYGVLLHWDIKTGLVNLIVLRKMVTDSFLKVPKKIFSADMGGSLPLQKVVTNQEKKEEHVGNSTSMTAEPSRDASAKVETQELTLPLPKEEAKAEPNNLNRAAERKVATDSNRRSSFLLGRFRTGMDALMTKSSGGLAKSKVPPLTAPFRVPRPDTFPPASIEITVIRARGLKSGRGKKADHLLNPYLKLTLAGNSHRTGTVKCTKNPIWTSRNHCKLVCARDNELSDDEQLEVEIYDWRPIRADKLLGVVYVPLSIVEAQPEDGHIPAMEVTLPCKMLNVPSTAQQTRPYASISLSLIHRDAYACWAEEELKARKLQSSLSLAWLTGMEHLQMKDSL